MAGEDSGLGVLVLGLDGFRLVAATEADGELLMGVETDASWVACSVCGTRAKSKGRRKTMVRDLPVGGRPVVLVWFKRRWRCPEADCGVKSWTETSPQIRPRAVLSERARREAARRVGEDGRSVAAVAREFGVGWSTVMDAVRRFGEPLVEAQLGSLRDVAALGMDEHRWRSAPDKWATGFVDLGTGRLLDVVQGRSGAAARRFLAAEAAETRRGVGVVALDPWRGYLTAARDLLPEALVTVDRFHIVRLANQVVTEVRQRTQQEVLGRRGRRGDPLYVVRRMLLVGRERLTDGQRRRLEAALAHRHGDVYDEIACAWWAKEHLRDVYAAPSLTEARQRLAEFYEWAELVQVPEVDRLARTINTWQTEVLNYHRTQATNGPTEAVNLLIEKTRRQAHGFRNWDNYRLRLLLQHGVMWYSTPTKRIRGHKPPLAA